MTNLFKVEGQTLTPLAIYEAVSDTVNYLTFAFMFSYDWAGLTKSAIFTRGTDVYEVVLTDDEVLEIDHVNLSAGVWEISVVGDTVVDAVVTRQITTSSYNFNVTQASATSGGVFPPSVASQVYVNVNQSTEQTLTGGVLKLSETRVISDDHHVTDKKYVDDHTPPTPDHNDLDGLQGGTTNEYYHVTSAEKTVIQNTSGMNTGDQVLPTRDSLGLDTDDTVTFANLSGMNTGDQDVSGAISMHNTASDAHSILARKTETMRLLISRTIGAGENVSAITWTQDDAGNALALIDCKLVISIPVNSVSVGSRAFIRGRFNDVVSGYYADYISSTAAGAMFVCIIRTTYGATVFETQKTNPLVARVVIGASDGTNNSNNSGVAYCAGITGNITKIYLYTESITYFPVGTTFEIYGRTA